VLHEEYNTNITFGELAPSVSFVNSKGVYLSGKGAQNIEVKIINVPKVKVIISKIYESNLLMASRYGYYPKESSRSGSSSGAPPWFARRPWPRTFTAATSSTTFRSP